MIHQEGEMKEDPKRISRNPTSYLECDRKLCNDGHYDTLKPKTLADVLLKL